jgi:predicted aldo/keto reductase-like oxidoreductase
LRTDHLDLWQLHDVRTLDDLNRIFGPGGALEAMLQARTEGRVRFLGVTGHHDPSVLVEALRRFAFDSVLLPLNPADVHWDSFAHTVLPEAASRKVGVIGMKVVAQGALLKQGILSMADAISYALSFPAVSTVVIGCRTQAEVEENVRIARQFTPLSALEMKNLEDRTKASAKKLCTYKCHDSHFP